MDISILCIGADKTVLEAMKQLDMNARQILYVTDERKLVSALTDGDIRRHLLRGGQLSDNISEAAHSNPKYLHEMETANARRFMLQNHVKSVPVVNENLEILDIIFLDDVYTKRRAVLNLPVVVMAGGKGTRLYPYTKVLPKPLIPIGDLPIVEHIMNKFIEFGCKDFYYIVNHKKEMIRAYFNEEASAANYKISFFDENMPLGTGGGLSLLKGEIKQTFFLTNCDSLLLADYDDIYRYHKAQENKITMVCVYKHLTIPYGVISMGEKGEIEGIEEKPEYSFLTNTGFYLVEPDVLDGIEENVAISFPEIMERARGAGGNVSVYPVSEMSWLDMGKPDEMENMRKRLEYDE